jgi:hypothetical protein
MSASPTLCILSLDPRYSYVRSSSLSSSIRSSSLRYAIIVRSHSHYHRCSHQSLLHASILSDVILTLLDISHRYLILTLFSSTLRCKMEKRIIHFETHLFASNLNFRSLIADISISNPRISWFIGFFYMNYCTKYLFYTIREYLSIIFIQIFHFRPFSSKSHV